ncbi:MAG: hypothetical protein WDN23_20660 [Edaphobacter sp.]
MRRLLITASLVLLTQTGLAQTKARSTAHPLNDAALDRVTAGGVTAGMSDGVVKFQGSVPTKNGLVTGAGSLSVLSSPMSSTTNQGTLTLNGTAQQNLTSLVNINAVNSNVNVLLNLNVNINSSVGTLTQTNLTGKH